MKSLLIITMLVQGTGLCATQFPGPVERTAHGYAQMILPGMQRRAWKDKHGFGAASYVDGKVLLCTLDAQPVYQALENKYMQEQDDAAYCRWFKEEIEREREGQNVCTEEMGCIAELNK